MEYTDAPNIEPGRGRLYYDKARRTIVSTGGKEMTMAGMKRRGYIQKPDGYPVSAKLPEPPTPFDPPWWIRAIVAAVALSVIVAFFMLVVGCGGPGGCPASDPNCTRPFNNPGR